MSGIEIKNLSKTYDGKQYVLEDFNLIIDDGDFLVLLGPSGCGKSTLLRLIAGLEDLQKGEILIGNTRVNDTPPKDRDIAMVFQNYALYPHMSVYQNLAIPLTLKKTPRETVDTKVNEIAGILGIQDLLDRKPRQLSGGQMQRVALGRAMVRNPQVYLMDEPLSNLDAKLRMQTRTEIIKLHKRLGITTVYVTHDQIEAMTMATRIVLMNKGEIMQSGTPGELYKKPQNLFTASFIGSPEINLIPIEFKDKSFTLFGRSFPLNYKDGKAIAGIRAEDIAIVEGDEFIVDIIENLGSEQLVTLKYMAEPEQVLVVKSPSHIHYELGEKVNIEFSKESLHLFDGTTEERITE